MKVNYFYKNWQNFFRKPWTKEYERFFNKAKAAITPCPPSTAKNIRYDIIQEKRKR